MTKKLTLIFCLVFGVLFYQPSSCQPPPDKYYVAIEFNGVLCGYSEVHLSDTLIHGAKMQVMVQEVHFDFSALGRDMSQYQRFTYHIDPESGNFTYHDSFMTQGDDTRGGEVYVESGKVRFRSTDNGDETIVDLPEHALLPNTQMFYHLKKDFADRGSKEKEYQVFDVRTGGIQKYLYVKTGEEKLSLANQVFETVQLNETDPSTGFDSRIWIDKKTGMRLRSESPTHLTMYLADASVRQNITKGNWDDVILGKTNKYISSIHGISSMKVKVRMDALPSPSLEDLTVNGQSFSGTVKGKSIEGIFEISHPAYTGENAPGFPLDRKKYKELDSYLEPGIMIESDDPVLREAAREITEGSENLWDATCRITRWVVKNIDGSLKGGSARETYDRKNGLCAAQSMVTTALCRAAGIPSRVVWGCMYTHEKGGSFGHHAWNEVFMGENGWIPLDVTAHEPDFVDSGHIRLGEVNTVQTILNYQKMGILDYQSKSL